MEAAVCKNEDVFIKIVLRNTVHKDERRKVLGNRKFKKKKLTLWYRN